jgi:hypothetical protein
MKDNKHIESFRQFNENLNISDVMNSCILVEKDGDYFFINNDKVKYGDWYYYNGNIRKHVAPEGYSTNDLKKIIATTSDLDGCMKISKDDIKK